MLSNNNYILSSLFNVSLRFGDLQTESKRPMTVTTLTLAPIMAKAPQRPGGPCP